MHPYQVEQLNMVHQQVMVRALQEQAFQVYHHILNIISELQLETTLIDQTPIQAISLHQEIHL